MVNLKPIGIVTFILTMVASCQAQGLFVNLYTDRHYKIDQDLFNTFTTQTGIRVNVVKLDADPLLTRLETEGTSTDADLIFLADAGRLGRAKAKGLLKVFPYQPSLEVVPSYLKDIDQQWIGLTKRARILVYDPRRIEANQLSTYEALGQPNSTLKVAVRSSSHVYNQSLVASMIEQIGTTATSVWIEGLVNNFAIRDPITGRTNPVGNDRDQAKAVYNQLADVAIMNSYYFGRMLYSENKNEVQIAESLEVFFPNQATFGTHIFGTHINISGVGLTKHGKRQANALALIDFLLSSSSQKVFADGNFEYPVRNDVDPHPLLQSWGSFEEQTISLSTLYSNSQEAFQLMEKAGWR
jgi:iron(III) transport system substrate-binding protein